MLRPILGVCGLGLATAFSLGLQATRALEARAEGQPAPSARPPGPSWGPSEDALLERLRTELEEDLWEEFAAPDRDAFEPAAGEHEGGPPLPPPPAHPGPGPDRRRREAPPPPRPRSGEGPPPARERCPTCGHSGEGRPAPRW